MSNLELAQVLIKAIWIAAGITAWLVRGDFGKAQKMEKDLVKIYNDIERRIDAANQELERNEQEGEAWANE